MSKELTKRERTIIKAAMGVAHAMHDYAASGADDYDEIGEILCKCMSQMTNQLNDELQVAFADWLLRKTEETTMEIINMERGLAE